MQRSTHPTAKYHRSSMALARCVMIILVLGFIPFGARAQDSTPEAETEVPMAPALVATDVPEPVIEPTAVVEETIEPTIEPATTETPVAEPTPTIEATVEPTAEPTGVPIEEPAATQSPTPMASPTPKAVKSLAVASTTGGICTFFYGQDLVYPQYAIFNCTSVGEGSLRVTAPPAGWRYTLLLPGYPGATGATTAFDQSFPNLGDFQIYLIPDQGTEGCAQLTVTATPKNGLPNQSVLEARTKGYTGTGTSCTAPPVKPAPTARLDGSLVPVGFSLTDRSVTGQLKIVVDNPSEATGWSLDVSSTELVYAGWASGQANWPASNLLVVAGSQSIPLSGAPQRIVEGGTGEKMSEFPVTLMIPGGSAAGTYSGTMTLTTSSAPGN